MGPPTRTTFLALAVLDEAIERARFDPLAPPEHGVRLALAYLWSISLSKNREPFDLLWRGLLGQRLRDEKPARLTWCGTQFARICAECGVQQDVELGAALARVRGTSAPDTRDRRARQGRPGARTPGEAD